jgi:hypothetical protein
VQHKKRSKKKQVLPPRLATEEQALVTSLLREVGLTDPAEIAARIPDSRHAQIMIEKLPLEGEFAIPLLMALDAAFEDKQVHKSIKRALFKLKNRGAAVEKFYVDSRPPSPAILRPAQKDKPQAYLGPVETKGFRSVLILLYRDMKGVDMGVGLVSDEHGIQHFLFTNVSKKRAKETKEHIFQEAGPLVETSLSHAFTVLEAAYQCHLAIHPQAPSDYLEIRPWFLENVAILDRPAIYDFMPEQAVSDEILTDSQLEKLFQHKLMDAKLIEFESLRPFMKEILETENSPIFLTEGQKSERQRNIKEKCMDALFPIEKRSLLKRWLEEMAYVFFKLEEKKIAELSLAAARRMDQENTILRKNPVIQLLLDRSLDFYMDKIQEMAGEEKQGDASAPGIILP